MKKAAVYMRVSTANQEDEKTIDSQLIELRERIEQDGHLLSPERIYGDDGWTGTLLERPALDRLRTDAKEGKFEVLYFYDRGRVARKFVYQEVVLDELRELGIECVSLHDVNGDTPEEYMMGSVMGIFHEYERVKITERMRLGKMRKVRESKKLLGYNPCYGYDYHHRIKGGLDERDGYFSINKKEAEVVRQIFQWVADGVSLRDVIRRLYELEIPPKKHKRTTWTKGPVARMLANTTYTGKHYYNKTEAVVTKNPRNPEQKYRRVRKNSRTSRPKEEWLMIEVPSIVDEKLFEKVQKQLKLNKKFSRRNNSKNQYLLTGIVQCICGKSRTGDPATHGHTYYRCTDRLSKFPLPRECFEPSVNASVVDSLVASKVLRLMSNPDLVKKQVKRWFEAQGKTLPSTDAKKAKEKLSRLDEEEQRYTKAYGLNFLSERLYKVQMQELQGKRSELEQRVLTGSQSTVSIPKLTLEEIIVGVGKMLQSLDFTDKKAIIRKLVDKVIATKEEVIIWGHLPLLATEKVGLNAKYWNSRFAKCRQVDTL